MKIEASSIVLEDVHKIVPNPKNIEYVENEKWANVSGYIYIVSSHGRLYNTKTCKLRKPTPDRYGYLTYGLWRDGRNKTTLAHRIVAKAFFDDYSESLVVNHIDYNRQNNKIENLNMCTVGENVRHSSSVGRYTKRGISNNNCKYSDEKILTILTLIQSGMIDRRVGEMVGVSRKYVNDVKLGKIRKIL